MSDFILATVSIVYVLICLTIDVEQGERSASDSVEDNLKKDAEE